MTRYIAQTLFLTTIINFSSELNAYCDEFDYAYTKNTIGCKNLLSDGTSSDLTNATVKYMRLKNVQTFKN